jgi:hypothetical protein
MPLYSWKNINLFHSDMPSIAGGAASGPSPTPSGSNSATYSDNGMVYSPPSREGARSPSSPRYLTHEQSFSTSPPSVAPIAVKARAPPQHAVAETVQNYHEPPRRPRESNNRDMQNNHNERHEPMDERERWRRERERESQTYREPSGPSQPAPRYTPIYGEDRAVVQRTLSPESLPVVPLQQPPPARNNPAAPPPRSKERERQERQERVMEREEQREKSKKEKQVREENGWFIHVLWSC